MATNHLFNTERPTVNAIVEIYDFTCLQIEIGFTISVTDAVITRKMIAVSR